MRTNFAAMHNNIISEIVDAGITEEMIELEYINRFRNTIKPKDSF